MLRSSRTGPTKIGSLTRASAVIVGALVALFGVIAGPLLGVFATSASAAPTGSGYTAITPYRALGTASAGASVVAGTPAVVQVTSSTAGEVPAGATAAVLNVTASNPSSAGYLEVYPDGAAPATPTSNVNFVAGETVPNLVTVPLSASGAIDVANFAGTTAVDVDVEGFYSATGAGLYNPVSPVRVAGTAAAGAPIAANTAIPVTVAGGTTSIPSSATAVVVNLTAAGGTSASYLSAYAAGATPATTSSVNFTAGETVANRDIVNVGTGGQIEVYNLAGSVNVDVDVDGYYGATGSQFVALAAPVRVADTRPATAVGTQTSIASGGTEAFNLTTTASGIPTTATSVAANFTVVPGAAPGYIQVFPTGEATPTGTAVTSDVNWPASSGPVANFTQANTAGTTAGSVQVYNLNSGSPIDLVIDAFGYFTTPTSGVAVVATPSTVTTAGGSASSVVATVTNAGAPVVGDTVAVATTPSVTGACGTIPATGITGAGGTVTLAYAGTTVVGTCTIKVTEANNGLSGTTVITQAANNTVTMSPNNPTPAAPHPNNASTAGGLITQAITATVTTPAAAPVVGDVINFTLTPLTAGGCGTLSAASATTAAGGVATTTYTMPFVVGLCTVTGTEAAAQTGESAPQSGTSVQDSTSTTAPVPATLAFTTLAANVPEGGTATVTATALTAGSAPVPNDQVLLLPGAGCGTFNTTSGATNASGAVSFTYTAPATVGTCTLSAIEAQATKTVTAPAVLTTTANNAVALTASPSSVAAGGAATSTITATVTSFGGTAVSGDLVSFGTAAAPAGSCGTFTPAAAGTTNASGVLTVTYTPSITPGFCTITATEHGTGSTMSTVIDQT